MCPRQFHSLTTLPAAQRAPEWRLMAGPRKLARIGNPAACLVADRNIRTPCCPSPAPLGREPLARSTNTTQPNRRRRHSLLLPAVKPASAHWHVGGSHPTPKTGLAKPASNPCLPPPSQVTEPAAARQAAQQQRQHFGTVALAIAQALTDRQMPLHPVPGRISSRNLAAIEHTHPRR